ncbi:SdrD B-like domain-containing protein, partial [uncultured Nonlabens sp.]|uniref:beta strand repeat-containing protein n=1 Tax=uncultured Nonlabens sp. TaxID=859306 RepID=UPI00260661ED
ATVDIDETTLPTGAVQTEGTDPTTVIVASGTTVVEEDNGIFTPMPNLNVVKTAGAVVDVNMNGINDAGDTITYSFSITNNGNVEIRDVVISDALLSLVNEPVTPSVLAVGQSGVIGNQTYMVTSSDVSNGRVVNTAVGSGEAFDTNGNSAGPVSDDSDDPNNVSDANPDGDSDPDDPTVVPLGTNGIFNGVVFDDANGNGVQDMGEMGLGGVTVNVTDSTMAVVTVFTNPDGTWSVVVPAGTPTADIDETTLPNGGSEIQTAGTNPTTVTVGVGENVGQPADGFFNAMPNLELEKISGGIVDANMNGLVDAGDTITYSFVVNNNGNVEVRNAVVNDMIIGMTGVSVTPSTIPAGGTGTVPDYVYVLLQADIDNGQIVNTAVLSGDAFDPNGDGLGPVSDNSDDPNNDMDSDPDGDGDPDDPTITDLSQPNLAFAKADTYTDINNNGIVDTLDTITYNFTVTNTGNTVVTGVSIDDSVIGVSNLIVTPSTLNPGDFGSAMVTYNITAADISAGEVRNTAQVTGQTTDSQGNILPDVSDDSDDPDDTINVDNDGDGDFEDPTVFVIEQNGLLTGTVFDDQNGNGVQDLGEPGIEGVDVVITDEGGISQFVTTDADGNWIAVVPSGVAIVNVQDPIDSTLTTVDSDPENVTVVAGSEQSTSDDGYTDPLTSGTVSGVVFDDQNGNGI